MAADFYSRDIFMTNYGATPSNFPRLIDQYIIHPAGTQNERIYYRIQTPRQTLVV